MEDFKPGLIDRGPIDGRDWVLGADNKMPRKVRSEKRDYTKLLPKHELQNSTYMDSYGCVSFSALNCLEIIVKQDEKREMNRSDRYTVVMSGTTPGVGNSLANVAQSVRTHKTVAEEVYPYPKDMKEEEYYATVPANIIAEAQKWPYETFYEWVGYNGVSHAKLFSELKFGPLQVTVDYTAMVQNKRVESANHAATLFKMDQLGPTAYKLHIFDHYQKAIRVVDGNFYVSAAMRHEITKKNDMLRLIKAEGPDVYAVGVDGHRYRIEDSMEALNMGVKAGLWSGTIEDVSQSELLSLPLGATIQLFNSLRD